MSSSPAIVNFGMSGIKRHIQEENIANRRKPRMYASFDFGSDESPYPLDFCMWLHRNFDGLVLAINAGTLHTYDTW